MSANLKNAIRAINKSALLYGSVSALALSGMSGVVNAQEEGLQTEEVVVTGIRGALEQAVAIKRMSTSIVDAISAEDVGEFPDSDVGESLGRIPGITVGRDFGQGGTVSIRGASPDMTLTQLNGQNVASTGWYDQQPVPRSFNYSLLPSELIGGIEVYKSSQADLNEGGIGGTVIVKTRKPLDMDANSAFAGIKATRGSISDDIAPQVSGLYSWKNDAETFGVLVAGAWEDSEYVRRGTEADLRWSGDVTPSTFVQERERTALDANIQFAPTDALNLNLHVLSLELSADNVGSNMYLFPGAAASTTCQETNAAGVCVLSVVEDSPVFVQSWARVASMSSDTFELSGEYIVDNITISGSVGKSEAEGGTDLTTNFAFPYPLATQWSGTIDATGNQIDIITTEDPSITFADLPTDLAPSGSWATKRGPNTDEETYAQLDVEFELEVGVINSFKAGVRSTDHDLERLQYDSTFNTTVTTAPTQSLYGGSYEVGSHGFTAPEPNLDAMVALTEQNVAAWTLNRSAYSLLNEKNDALYGMFTFEGEGFRGNFGLRYIKSDVTATQYALDATPLQAGDIAANNGYSYDLSDDNADYSDVLPSMNASFDVDDNIVLRFAAAQAISRPAYDNMVVSYSGYADTVIDNQAVNRGSAGLLPMKSTQADISLEYYYGDGNLVAATYFVKSISNFVTSDLDPNQQIGVDDPDRVAAGEPQPDNWTVNTVLNGGAAELSGVELQVSHAFDNGFGVVANYTYVDGEIPEDTYPDHVPVFTGSSQNSANLVGYWENDIYSARLAYNWRSEYMTREGALYYGNRMRDDYGQLDMSLGWNATDNIAVTLEATNLLAEDDVQFGAAPTDTALKNSLKAGFPAWSFEGETRIMLGVNFRY